MNAVVAKTAETHPLTWRIDSLGGQPLDLKTYESLEGFAALRKAVKEMTPEAVQAVVKDANLRGRGGAGFPAGVKWSLVPMGEKAPKNKYLICNADEMEPGTFKDRLLMEQLPQERMLIALGCVATMERAVEETVAYTKERKLFGDNLFAMQNTRFKLAECKTKAVIARDFVDQCMVQVLAGQLDASKAAMAKWWCTQTNCEIIDECLQLHGGYGYMTEYPIARLYADVRVNRIYGGTSEVMKTIIAKDLGI